MALKELEVRYATKRSRDYKLSDGEGLHLLVRPNGSTLTAQISLRRAREAALLWGLSWSQPRAGAAAPAEGPEMSWRSRPSKVARNIFARRVW